MTPFNARVSSNPEQVAALAARTMVGRNGLAEDSIRLRMSPLLLSKCGRVPMGSVSEQKPSGIARLVGRSGTS
jgi:hypothetical protein